MNPQRKFIPVFLFSWAIVFGGLVRFYAAWKAGFPIVDGGMFLVMARDLQASHYLLPVFTSYNNIQIPYAYPPLGFYLLAGINQLFGTSLLALLQWLPAIFSALTIPAFALLAQRILGTSSRAALATFFYTLTPQAFDTQLMGGGLTRSLGALLAILVIYFAIRMFQEKSNKMLTGTILMGALTIYSHPEWALQAATAGVLVWWFFGRNKVGIIRAIVTVLGIIALTAPWWVTVAAHHGPGIFLLASQSHNGRLLFWWPLVSMSFSSTSNILMIGLGLIGIFICLRNNEHFLPVWVIACFLVDVDSAGHVISIPLTLLATITLSELVFPWLLANRPNSSGSGVLPDWTEAFSNRLCQVMFAYLLIAMLVNSFSFVTNIANLNTLPLQDRQAMEWVRENTPPDSRFVVIGWTDSPWVSPLTEWFPALSGRYSLTTVQGREWLPGSQNVTPRIDTFEDIQSCLYQTFTCLENWSESHAEPYDYVTISLHDPTGAPGAIRLSSLYLSLSTSQNYTLVLNEPTVKIFRLRK